MFIIRNPQQRQGFTLIEMLVALTINVLLLASLVGIFASNLSNYNKVIDANRLNQQLQGAITLIANDIRRAGFWGNASSNINVATNNNPFMASGVDLSAPSSSCTLFAYDYNSNGSIPSVNSSADDERYGYRTSNQVLQTRPWGASFSCSAAANVWENVTDATVVQITNLTITINTTTVPVGATSLTMVVRSVDISLTGRLTNNTSVTKTLTQHIRVRNDKFVP